MTFSDFQASLRDDRPNDGLAVQLKSLWYDSKGDWQRAHGEVDHLDDKDSAWVHAYLHRKEGDTGNADYWYRKAGKIPPGISLDAEWEAMVIEFLFK